MVGRGLTFSPLDITFLHFSESSGVCPFPVASFAFFRRDSLSSTTGEAMIPVKCPLMDIGGNKL